MQTEQHLTCHLSPMLPFLQETRRRIVDGQFNQEHLRGFDQDLV